MFPVEKYPLDTRTEVRYVRDMANIGITFEDELAWMDIGYEREPDLRCTHPEESHETVEYPGGVRVECGECGEIRLVDSLCEVRL